MHHVRHTSMFLAEIHVLNEWIPAKNIPEGRKVTGIQDLKDSGDIKENNTELTPRRGDWRKIEDVTFPLTTHLGENVLHNRGKNDCRRQVLEEPEAI